jgi:hypothetical protein
VVYSPAGGSAHTRLLCIGHGAPKYLALDANNFKWGDRGVEVAVAGISLFKYACRIDPPNPLIATGLRAISPAVRDPLARQTGMETF